MQDFRTIYQSALFKKSFSNLKEPRRTNKGNFQHLLSDIVFMTISAVLSGANDWQMVGLFGNDQEQWLKKYGAFAKGIPSRYTVERVFSLLDPQSFGECFTNWVTELCDTLSNGVIAIDGKCIRGVDPKSIGTKMAYIVSAFSSSNNLCLAQVKVDEKSNEITAIPNLLQLMELTGCTVTIDAMGCQTKIAEAIIDKKADYILAAKNNQPSLYSGILQTEALTKPIQSYTSLDADHGRIEERECLVFSDLSHINVVDKWERLTSIAVINSKRTDKKTGKESSEKRYYITSLKPQAKEICKSIRDHWSVENNLHWTLDVTFGEDKSRKRKGNSAENFNIILKTALAMLVKETELKMSKKNKRMKASLNHEYREKLMGIGINKDLL